MGLDEHLEKHTPEWLAVLTSCAHTFQHMYIGKRRFICFQLVMLSVYHLSVVTVSVCHAVINFFLTVTVTQVILGVVFPLGNENTAFSVLDFSLH